MKKIKHPEQIRSYFRLEILPLAIVTISGIIYNIGMTAGPYFEGKLAQRLLDIMNGKKTLTDMMSLAAVYLVVILIVQTARCLKRFYVRRFANDTSRNMRHMLYNSLVHKTKSELEEESVGAVMTKAIADVDACVEGMRKFTTEVFDTGVVLVSYLTMLFVYDWRLACISCMFTPIAYVIADRLKVAVTRYNAAYKNSAGKLNDATLDRIGNALTYRVYGREAARNEAYDRELSEYEKCAVAANVWGTSMQPVYNTISMCGVIPILYFGAKNVLGTGWTAWDIAAFTTFLSCFAKMAKKSSTAAKLFNAVQKAKVSWKRLKPLMKEYVELDLKSDIDFTKTYPLTVKDLSFGYSDSEKILKHLSFFAQPGEVIGVTGPVASGKSTLGKVFLGEGAYEGSIRIGDVELCGLSEYERSRLISYMGHQPELMSDTIEENVCLGEPGDVEAVLKMVCFAEEVAEMPEGRKTFAGNGGVRLSGGQQARTALARTLYHGRTIMILDDPFSAVDKKTEHEIMENIRRTANDKIIFLISHRLYQFPEFDRVIWLENGEGTIGTHEELMRTNTLYAELYNTQMAGGDLDEV